MKYNLQTRLKTNTQRGNCFPTVISCIMDLDSAEDVLQLQELYGNDSVSWWEEIVDWCESKGWKLDSIEGHLNNDEYYFVTGKSPREISHIVIYQNGKMIHDPHPEGGGLLPGTESMYFYLQKIK